ncbi:RNA-binding cell elongation regulator Jag/EloR [Heliorestis convoluta]|uniref:RNA-binding protein KhpB n=1 Tax=Heliorestis convoluta TaxID=356322 RepID=A0A5Q2MYG2_9FIRM|nr:Single-stranded nucleic acid binding R3H domain protein [Heliorestis convoluta]
MTQPIIVEKTAKTVKEAVNAALAELQLEEKDVEVHVIEEPSKGFLGLIGVKPARVKVTVKPDPLRDTLRFLNDIFQTMEVQAEIIPQWKDEILHITFKGDDLGILIGRRGDTLDSLQYLTNLAINRQSLSRIRIILDVENYRQRREETLVRLAKRLGDKVKRSGTRVALEPMSPQERRIIHTALQGDPKLSTFSEGEDPFRKVVIVPKQEQRRPRGNNPNSANEYKGEYNRSATATRGKSRPYEQREGISKSMEKDRPGYDR